MLVRRVCKSSSRRIYWEPETPVLGILAFEISGMMSKVVNIWHSLSNRQIARLREEISISVGIHKLVSQDDNYLMDLALAEIVQNFITLGKSVAKLGKKCADSTYHNLETIFDDSSLLQDDPQWYGWQYRLKKMERKVRKMERFVAVTEELRSELEALAELERSLKQIQASLKQIQAGKNLVKMKLLEFEQKLLWQRQEVKSLQEISPWVRTYDYVVRLLLRSLLTIIARFKYAYRSDHIGYLEMREEVSFFNIRSSLLNAAPSTLGYAALQLHYANVIILIERLASSTNSIGVEERDDLYDMLPSTIRSHLRERLKTFDYGAALVAEWSSEISKIFEWLSPLARNTIRWQCERSFGRQRVICGSNTLLVQTLYFANQAETESAIVELVVGLSCLHRFRHDNVTCRYGKLDKKVICIIKDQTAPMA